MSDMQMTHARGADGNGWHLDRRVPIALILTLILQAGTAVWWASAKQQQDDFRDHRVEGVEQGMGKLHEGQAQIAERLARIEERQSSLLDMTRRIEQRTGAR